MWQKVAKFKGAEYFRKALYIYCEPEATANPRLAVELAVLALCDRADVYFMMLSNTLS